jgi:hypothetical protein
MPADIKVILLKSWKHPYKIKPLPIGKIMGCSPQLASELIADKIAELYTGVYPPKEKTKTEFFKPK